MNPGQLVKMANQIEAFFRSEPDEEVAVGAIENHLRRIWAPRMRRAIVAHVELGAPDLGDLATRAVRRRAARG